LQHRPFKHFGIYIDIARQIERPHVLFEAIKGMGRLGYTHCMVNLEDAFLFKRHPGIARQNAYTVEFMREFELLCASEGMELIPAIPSLSHCHYITTKKGYEKYDEGRGTDNNWGTVSPSFPETYTLLGELYEDWCNYIPGSYIQLGLDEAAAMGNYHCRTWGKETFDYTRMFAEHANKLNKMCKSLGRRMIIGGDMFYYIPQAIDLVDNDIIILDWFYYRFDKKTRVEAFNFSDIDLSGDLKKKGFEVWGTAAVWPNSPFCDVEDRWGQFCDWVRYGREKNLEGLVLCDFENNTGFYGSVHILMKAFATNINRPKMRPIKNELANVLADKLQVSENNPRLTAFVNDVMNLGQYHVTGHQNRRLFLRPLETLANKNRQSECLQKYNELEKMFRNFQKLYNDAKTENGRIIINGLYVSHKFLLVLWKFGALLPDCYSLLCQNTPASDNQAKAIMTELADDAKRLVAEYTAHWNKVRYENDRQPAAAWANNAIVKLQQWIDAVKIPNRNHHSFVATPRIECTLHCHHPALPVAMISAIWSDGYQQKVNETMICFESKYAWPNVKWKQFPCIPLERQALPEKIKIESVNYGQVGVQNIGITWKGAFYPCKLIRTSGQNVEIENDVVWLGPVCQRLDSPLLRTEYDEALYNVSESPL